MRIIIIVFIFVLPVLSLLFYYAQGYDQGNQITGRASQSRLGTLTGRPPEAAPARVACFFPGLDCQTLLQPIEKDGQVVGYGVLLPQDSVLISPVWGEATTGQLNMLLPGGFKGFQVLTVYPDKDAKPARIEFILAQVKEFTPKTLIKGARIIDISAGPADIGRFGRFDLVISAFDAQDKLIDPRSYLDKP